jgi:hypothetical protein
MSKMQNIDKGPLYDLLSHHNRASGIGHRASLWCCLALVRGFGTADIFRGSLLPMIHGRRYVILYQKHVIGRKDALDYISK